MKKAIANDLTDLTIFLENFKESLQGMTQADKIDVAARLKPIAKACKAIDENVKEMVKIKLKHKEGTVTGELFKAVLTLVDTKRLNQKLLKEEEPDIHDAYNEDAVDERVSFELR